MPKPNSTAKSKLKQWLINLIIALITLAVMVMVGEATMRWLDGYNVSGLELEHNQTIQQGE